MEEITLKQLREIREATIKRWKESGLLDGLTGNIKENVASMFECCPSYIINEDNETNNIDNEEGKL
jgi:signal transduction protein with GAF and PtsI domain